MNSKSNAMVYFKQLNGIRFIAVMLVLIDHWFAELIPAPLGQFGVVIFFVLSGFLITRILFEYKDRFFQKNIIVPLKFFIVRRSLRIFPIYFLICLIGLIFNISSIRENYIWLLTYTTNYYIIFKKTWMGVWDHFWSLAVEEQYYLFFPIIILKISNNRFKSLFYFMIILGISARFFFYFINKQEFRQEYWFLNNVNLITALDCFGIGALLAYSYYFKLSDFKRYISNFNLFLSLILVIADLIINQNLLYYHGNLLFTVFERLIFSIFSFQIIGIAILERKNILGDFLENHLIEFIGKISYGIYLYHNFIFNVYHNKGNTLFGYFDFKFGLSKISIFQNQLFLFLFNFVILLFLSSFSWYCIEKPFNNLKKYFT